MASSTPSCRSSQQSRRWTDIWCSMPCINIDEQPGQIKERWDRFEDFTTNLLLFHRNYVSLDKFRIYAHCHNEQHVHVDRWVRLGIKYNPLVLEIEIPWDIGKVFKLPKVGSSLSRLTRLSLSNVILDSHFAELLVSGCPALVDLELTSCFSIPQDITLTTVKKFVMNGCYNIGDARRPIFIRAPKVVSLKLVTVDLRGISVCNATSLVKASVHNINFSAKEQCILLGGLSNVMSLELVNFDTLGMLDKSSNNFPLFLKMCTLSLKGCFLDEKYGLESKLADLGSFLENAPCLEKLTLSCCMILGLIQLLRGKASVCKVRMARLSSVRS
ncbi:hypothetical protein ACP4OV_012707 [Aristida adscensionis]